MAWTTPRTWVAGETVTAALLNTHVRDNLSFSYSPPKCRVTASSTANVTTATFTLVAFDGETWNTVGTSMHSTSSNNSRLIATVAGKYRLDAHVDWTPNATGIRAITVRKNSAGSSSGGTLMGLRYFGAGASWYSTDLSDVFDLAANDYLEVFRYQSSGGNLAPYDLGMGYAAFATFAWVGA